jgi:hypothetical protein
MRIERFIPRPRGELWRALIEHAELGEDGPMLRLALDGGVSASAGKITAYQSEKILECAWHNDVLRWELHARGEPTLLVFTHERSNETPWRAFDMASLKT